jgi:hypothetical protein
MDHDWILARKSACYSGARRSEVDALVYQLAATRAQAVGKDDAGGHAAVTRAHRPDAWDGNVNGSLWSIVIIVDIQPLLAAVDDPAMLGKVTALAAQLGKHALPSRFRSRGRALL